MATVECFEDLQVWKEARAILGAVYRLTEKFPSQERYGLASQIQRAAVSTMSNIAEGFERGTNKEFVYFLYVAKGSVGEVRSQAYAAYDLHYVSQTECARLVENCKILSRRLYKFINYLKSAKFDGPRLCESAPAWDLENSEVLSPEPETSNLKREIQN